MERRLTARTWERLLPPEVLVEDDAVGDDVGSLLPEELAEIRAAVRKRRLEYAAGRKCARRVLARLGFPERPLLGGAAREPLWPDGVAGAISHAAGWCAAAVARTGDVAALGIDLEEDAPLDEELWRLIATAPELEALSARPAHLRGAIARLLFSAKESFYKCQFPATREVLDFRDVAIEPDLERLEFTATLLRPAGPLAPASRFRGRFARESGLLITAMAWKSIAPDRSPDAPARP